MSHGAKVMANAYNEIGASSQFALAYAVYEIGNFIEDFADFWGNDFIDFWEHDVNCALFGGGCEKPKPLAFKDWWKTYQAFSSD